MSLPILGTLSNPLQVQVVYNLVLFSSVMITDQSRPGAECTLALTDSDKRSISLTSPYSFWFWLSVAAWLQPLVCLICVWFFCHITGIFTAPVRGVYLFSLFECSLSPQPASLSLHKNDQMIVSVAKRRFQHDGVDNGSNGATLQLEQGDQVYVRLWKDSWVYDSTAHFTTFSGVLLFSLWGSFYSWLR